MLGLCERQVRVIAPFVGGGFGPKIMMFYPEEVLLPWVAMRLDRPVKWIEDRREHFFATTQERGQIHDAEIALDPRRPHPRHQGRVPARHRRLRSLRADGADQQPVHAARALRRSPNYDSTFTAVFTNKPIVTPYRGAGRQHGVFVIERLLDIAARELGIDRAEIRRRNFIPPDAFPYDNEIIYQDFAPLAYDSGNYEPVLDKALDADRLRRRFVDEEQPRLRAAGPPRRHRRRLLRRGHRHRALRGRQGAGAGERQGQRRHRHRHAGAGALHQSSPRSSPTRSASTCATSMWSPATPTSSTGAPAPSRAAARWWPATRSTRPAKAVREKILRIAAEHFECAEEDLEIADGEVVDRRRARQDRRASASSRCRPIRCAARSQPGTEPGLEVDAAISARRAAPPRAACTP